MKVKIGNKGVAFAWVTVVLAIFAFSIAYLTTYEVIATHLYNIAEDNGVPDNILSIFMAIWNGLPFIFMIGMLLYGIVASQKREPDTGYY